MENLVQSLRKKLLLNLLKDSRFEWRTTARLCREVEATEEETAALLSELGARKSTGVNSVWHLEY